MKDESNDESNYGSARDWTDMLSGISQGAGNALQGSASYANSKKDAKEAKRRTLANLLNQSLKRNQNIFRSGQENSDDINDYQSQAMQQMANGFVNALQGSTR